MVAVSAESMDGGTMRSSEGWFTVRLPELWSSTFSGNHAVLKPLLGKSVPWQRLRSYRGAPQSQNRNRARIL